MRKEFNVTATCYPEMHYMMDSKFKLVSETTHLSSSSSSSSKIAPTTFELEFEFELTFSFFE